MTILDAIIIGGGPSGSSAARTLVRGGARVAIIDRAEFPRVKLCAGWISAPIWDVLQLRPEDYPGGLWPWETCHVHFRGEPHAIRTRGWFIRRYELDDFLLKSSGAELHLGKSAKGIERLPDGTWQVGPLQARYLIGAGGTHCPVNRLVNPPRPRSVVGVQEHEFQCDLDAVARTRLGENGEPELLLHDDLRGYSWNVPKSDWLNVGTGTVDPTEVRAAWKRAADHFRAEGHVPPEAGDALDHVKGHSYYLFDPAHLDGAIKDNALIVGDSLGLAQPLTAEGILPAVLSGRTAAEAILAGDPASYPTRLRAHPIIEDYRRVFRMRELGAALGQRTKSKGNGRAAPKVKLLERAGKRAVATGFAWMFSGARLPAPRVVDLVLAGAERVARS